MAENKVAEVTSKVFSLLEPLTSEERRRVADAALTLLGETKTAPLSSPAKPKQDGSEALPPRAAVWIRQNGLTMQEVEQVFQVEAEHVELIAPRVPGKADKEKTFNCYVLCGIAQLLATGDPAFDDKSARAICKHLGCYNDINHATYIKEKGNQFAGTKDKGWKLTAPGLIQGALLVKELAGGVK
jgi:hypothetical protein